jgi:phage N-6-adenine-methyltransferase
MTRDIVSGRAQDWSTPWELYHRLDREYGFELDVCATSENTKCVNYYTPQLDGLEQSWRGKRCWCNPPYRDTRKWLEKAFREKENGAHTVMLLPANTDTLWFHDVASRGEVHLFRGRVKFIPPGGLVSKSNSPGFPSMLVIIGPEGTYTPGRFRRRYAKSGEFCI